MDIVFLDRDGVLNEDTGYTYKVSDFKITKGILEKLKKLEDKTFIVVTNQSGIGRKYYTKKDMDTFNEFVKEQYKKCGIHIQKFYFCPHTPEDECECRKPRPGLIVKAMKDYNTTPDKCIMIGDKETDIQAGNNAGVRSFYVQDL